MNSVIDFESKFIFDVHELIYYSPYSYITNTVRGPRKMADYLNLIREISEETVKNTALCFNLY